MVKPTKPIGSGHLAWLTHRQWYCPFQFGMLTSIAPFSYIDSCSSEVGAYFFYVLLNVFLERWSTRYATNQPTNRERAMYNVPSPDRVSSAVVACANGWMDGLHCADQCQVRLVEFQLAEFTIFKAVSKQIGQSNIQMSTHFNRQTTPGTARPVHWC